MARAPFAVPDWPALKAKNWPLAKIKPYDRNPRRHPDSQVELLAKLITEYGVDQPIVVDEHGVILKGHGRLLAAQKAGLKEFPVVQQLGLDDTEKSAIRVADNQVSLLSAWDPELLALEVRSIKLKNYDTTLLGLDDLDAILKWGAPLDGMPVLAEGDRAPFQQLTFTLHDSQVAVLSDAIKLAKAQGPFKGTKNENGNGNALARIASDYLKRNG